MMLNELFQRVAALERSDMERRQKELDQDQQIEALVRVVHIQRGQDLASKCDARTVRTRRAYALIWQVAVADSGKAITMNTAEAIRGMVAGDVDPPPGCAHTVDLIRDHYGKTPHVRTFYRALVEQRDLAELK